MPKELLTGTLEEQCAFLYDLAKEKMAEGNYTGALYALKEIAKYKPDYRDVNVLLVESKAKKSQQSRLVISGFLGAAVFVAVGTTLQLSNDILFLALAFVGAVIGYMAGLFLFSSKTIQKET